MVLAAAVLAGCGAPTASPSGSTPVTPTGYLSPSSQCSSGASFLTQAMNGDLSGCFRVPSLRATALVVSLQTYVVKTGSPLAVTTTTVPSLPGGALTLQVGSRDVTPGERVVLRGRYRRHAASPRDSYANLCWDGCHSGLVEQGVAIHWRSSTTFQMTLVVPRTAWLESGHHGVSVHPLTSGQYSVGVQCLGEISGCALGRSDATVELHLTAPSPTRCASSRPCTTLHLSSTRSGVGDVVEVSGWAPLESIIGQPFGFQLSVARAAAGARYDALSVLRTSKGGDLSVDLAPEILHVVASRTWSDLGRLTYVASSFAGPSPIDVVSGSNRIAWCEPTSLVVTKGATISSISTAGVAAALGGTNLSLFDAPTSHPPCSTVLMVPRYPRSVFAGFDTATSEGAPPIYLSGLYSVDAGTRWQRVPIPPGSSDENFAGFVANHDVVEALFSSPESGGSDTPFGTTNGEVATEMTTNGGLTWSTSTLGCPSTGPCASFGPYYWGNCAMNGSSQALLVAPRGATGALGRTWRNSSWPTTVNSCFAQQLVATSKNGLVLLDPSSQYPLLRSSDGGVDWSSFALPSNDGENFPDGAPLGTSLLMAPDGSLFATVTSASGTRESLLRLYPDATAWCVVPGVLGVSARVGVVGALRVSATDLVWSQDVYPTSGAETSTTHVVAFSHLRC